MGNAWFVHSVSGTDVAGNGYSPEAPLATIAFAITQAVASNDDLILCMPGHTEAVVAAGTIAVSKIGLTIRSMGRGRLRAVITYTSLAAASFNVTAANVTLDGLVFSGVGVAAVTAMVNVSASNCSILNCEFETANSTNQAALGVLTTAAADRMVIAGCHFHGTPNAGTATAIRIVGGDSIRVEGNYILGNFTTTLGGIQNVTTTATNIVIAGNVITNATASASVCITLHASCTGAVVNNRLGVLTGTAPIVAAGINHVGGNYTTATTGVTPGTLI